MLCSAEGLQFTVASRCISKRAVVAGQAFLPPGEEAPPDHGFLCLDLFSFTHQGAPSTVLLDAAQDTMT